MVGRNRPSVSLGGETVSFSRQVDQIAHLRRQPLAIAGAPDRWADYARAGRAHVEHEYDVATQAARLEELYDRVDAVLDKIAVQIADAVWESVPDATDKIFHSLEEKLRVKHLVREKIEAFDLDRLEAIAHEIAAREFSHIEFLGALLGGVIGVAQFGLYLLLR